MTTWWNLELLIFYKSSHRSFYIIGDIFKIAQKVSTYLSYFCQEILPIRPFTKSPCSCSIIKWLPAYSFLVIHPGLTLIRIILGRWLRRWSASCATSWRWRRPSWPDTFKILIEDTKLDFEMSPNFSTFYAREILKEF